MLSKTADRVDELEKQVELKLGKVLLASLSCNYVNNMVFLKIVHSRSVRFVFVNIVFNVKLIKKIKNYFKNIVEKLS